MYYLFYSEIDIESRYIQILEFPSDEAATNCAKATRLLGDFVTVYKLADHKPIFTNDKTKLVA